jgi:hypothetical protein
VGAGSKRVQNEIRAIKGTSPIGRLFEFHVHAHGLGKLGGVPMDDVQVFFVDIQKNDRRASEHVPGIVNQAL